MHKKSATFCIHSFGCKVNQYEGQLLREELQLRGLSEAGAADWHIVNGCVVTQTAQTECRRLVQRLRSRYPQSRIVITGCYGRILENSANEGKEGVVIIPQSRKATVASIVASGCARGDITASDPYIFRTACGLKGHSRAFVKIQDGCDQWCSYCIVPVIRGASRSKPLASIINEVKGMGMSGFKEIVLAGIDLGAWGKDLSPKENLAGLAQELRLIKGIERIRLSSLEMNHLSSDLIAEFKKNSKLCPQVHIPLQSGDDEILKRMNRSYQSRDFLNAIAALRQAVPHIAVTTDIMVGFPAETEQQFQNTLAVCREAGFVRAHIFPYSSRPGTAAAKWGRQVTPQVMRQRSRQIQAVVDETNFAYRRRLLHTTQQVLAEEQKGKHWTGYTDTYIPVSMAGSGTFSGSIVSVYITKVSARATEGKIV